MTPSGQSDSRVVCTTCGREERVRFAECLSRGWPKCHGQTMRLEECSADIDAAVAEKVAFG
jgi:hypothetical protein